MKNIERIVYGLIITIVIFLSAHIIFSKIYLNSQLIPDSFVNQTILLLFSVIAIYVLRKYISYNISLPKFRNILQTIAVGLIVTIVINIFMSVVIKLVGGKTDVHPALLKMNPIQVLILIIIYAPIAEEILFRGFLLNFLKPLSTSGITFLKRKISLPVIISAFFFGLAHLALITTGVGYLFILKTVLFATCLGLVSGYYQEKNNNNAYAIIVHMAGNLPIVLSAFILSMNS